MRQSYQNKHPGTNPVLSSHPWSFYQLQGPFYPQSYQALNVWSVVGLFRFNYIKSMLLQITWLKSDTHVCTCDKSSKDMAHEMCEHVTWKYSYWLLKKRVKLHGDVERMRLSRAPTVCLALSALCKSKYIVIHIMVTNWPQAACWSHCPASNYHAQGYALGHACYIRTH